LVSGIHKKRRRRPIEILIEILTLASPSSASSLSSSAAGATKTRLASASGLNFRRFERYLELLMKKKFLERLEDHQREELPGIYRTTVLGEEARLILVKAKKVVFDFDELDKSR
jgi:predicted transcriptional regulator